MIPTIGELKQPQFISLYFPPTEFRYRSVHTKLFLDIRVHKMIWTCDSIPFHNLYQISKLCMFRFDNPKPSCKLYFFIYWDWSSYCWAVPCWITLSDDFYPYFRGLFKYFIKVFHSPSSTTEPGTVLWRCQCKWFLAIASSVTAQLYYLV